MFCAGTSLKSLINSAVAAPVNIADSTSSIAWTGGGRRLKTTAIIINWLSWPVLDGSAVSSSAGIKSSVMTWSPASSTASGMPPRNLLKPSMSGSYSGSLRLEHCLNSAILSSCVNGPSSIGVHGPAPANSFKMMTDTPVAHWRT